MNDKIYTVKLTEAEVNMLLHAMIAFSDIVGDSLAEDVNKTISDVALNEMAINAAQGKVESYVDTMIVHERLKAKLEYAS